MGNRWSADELHAELERFEQVLRAAGFTESSVRTYVDRSRYFVRWLDGDYHPTDRPRGVTRPRGGDAM